MLGFSGIAELTQRFEEGPFDAAGQARTPRAGAARLLFLALGTLSRLVESLTQPPREAIDVQAVLDRLDSAQSPEAPGRGSAPGAEAPAAPAPRSPESSPAEDARRAHGGSEPGTDTLVEAERLDAISGFLTAAISHQMRQAD
jgi:hypothetical protein